MLKPLPMNSFRIKFASLFIAAGAFVSVLVFPQTTHAQGFYDFIRAIPQKDPNGVAIPGANTTFADGTTFQPVGDLARSSSWAFRPYGTGGILSSLGLNSSTPPTNTKELVTTVHGLKPGATYSVQVLFWGPDDALWGIRAGLQYAHGQRTNTWFDVNSNNVVEANLLPWKTIPDIFDEGGRTFYAVSLGNTTANASGDINVYVHDYPSGDSNRRTWYNGVAVSEVTDAASQAIDIGSTGTHFSRGVRGLALADTAITRGDYYYGIPKTLQVANGSAIRGVATGIAAELYDWRTRNGQPRPPTLQFLRFSRDVASELFLGINLRGVVEPNPAGGFRYYDTNKTTMAALAADWVRYVNHIVPTYRQGDSITNSRDADILNSLTWSSSVSGDNFDTLLAPGETSVPLVKYLEIGNEPTVGVTAYSVSNSFTLNSNDFYLRYSAVVQAIKAENPDVKVGPTIINAVRERGQLGSILADHSLPIDFIAYHPYERMGALNDPAEITRYLGSVYSRQLDFLNGIKRAIANNGRDPEAIEYAATEVNVSYWDINETIKEAQMAHTLGTVETVFSHARLGLVASHYWIWPAHAWDGTEYPLFKAYEKLRDHMGDTLLSVYAFRDIRVYTTRDSKTGKIAVWALNFSETETTPVHLQLENLPKIQRATLLRLQDKSGTTSLFSANPASDMFGGPAQNVDWASTNFTGQNLADFDLNLPAATLSLLVIEPGIEQLFPEMFEQGGEKWFSVKLHPLPNASSARYQLLGSADLKTWEVVAETSAGASEWISLADDQPIENSTHRFFRVEVKTGQ
jgi:hypothetical protein